MSEETETKPDMYATTLDIIELNPTVRHPDGDPEMPEAPYVNMCMEGRDVGSFPIEAARKMADDMDRLADMVMTEEIARFAYRLQDWKNGGDMP